MKLNELFLFALLLFTQTDLIGEEISFFKQTKNSNSSTTEQPSRLPELGVCDKSYPFLEGKVAYFFFTSSKMGDVYENGGVELQVSGSYPVYHCLQVYASLGYLQAWGHSENGDQDTTIWQTPLDIGLKSVFNIASSTQYYIGLGPRYFYVHQHNDSSYVNKNVSDNGIGLFVNMGFNFFPTDHFFIDLFGEYAYEPAHFSSSQSNVFGGSVQVSLLTFGVGLGYAF